MCKIYKVQSFVSQMMKYKKKSTIFCTIKHFKRKIWHFSDIRYFGIKLSRSKPGFDSPIKFICTCYKYLQLHVCLCFKKRNWKWKHFAELTVWMEVTPNVWHWLCSTWLLQGESQYGTAGHREESLKRFCRKSLLRTDSEATDTS